VSARVLCCCWPFPGHVNPNIAVARALRDRGDDVAIFTGEDARATIEAEGFPVFAFERVAMAWAPVRALERRAAAPGRRERLRAQAAALRGWLLGTIPAQIEDLESVIAGWEPDVIVVDPAMLGPIVVLWEKTGIPVAVLGTFMGPSLPGPDAPIVFNLGLPPARSRATRAAKALADRVVARAAAPVRRRVDEIRREHGLPPLGCSVNEHSGRLPLYLVGSVPELDYGRRDLPPSVHYVGPCSWQPPSDLAAAAWLHEVPTDLPWVHVTEGTSNSGRPFLLQAAARGLAGRPLRALLTTGHRDPRSLGLAAPAANVHVTGFLNHGDLLPRCAAIVTTGGAGTVLAAARAGVPQLVVPTTWDQPDNGRRLVEAGVGLSLAQRRCTPARLRAAVEDLLADDERRRRAERLGERLRRANGPERAAELLEGLVRPVAPQGRAAIATASLTPGKELA
jgi:MGT family glycosyltransferase